MTPKQREEILDLVDKSLAYAIEDYDDMGEYTSSNGANMIVNFALRCAEILTDQSVQEKEKLSDRLYVLCEEINALCMLTEEDVVIDFLDIARNAVVKASEFQQEKEDNK